MAFLVTTYLWDFGDGYTSIEEVPDHEYFRAGIYIVTLIVWTDVGSVSVAHTVTVLEPSTRNIEEFCMRYAVEPAQGRGWSECSGEDWVSPKDDYGILLMIDDNDTPRMLIEDQNDDFSWEDATFDRVEFQKSSFVDKYYEEDLRNADWRWILSGLGTNEYYLDKPDGGDPYIERPKEMTIGGLPSPEGTVITLQPGFWGWGDSDLLGYNTIYVRLPDNTDPDTKGGDYVHGFFWTEILCEEWEKELVADPNKQEDELELVEHHYFTRPRDPENKGNSNYDDNGYREAQQFDLEVYIDGTLTSPFATVEEIPVNGDITFSGKKIECRRALHVFKTAASEVQVAGLNHYGIAKPRQGTRDERSSRDTAVELALAAPFYWISRNAVKPLLERVGGSSLTGDVTAVAGPDGFSSSALQINANLTLGNGALGAEYTVVYFGLVASLPNIGAIPAATAFGDAFNGWRVYFVNNINLPAALVITPGTLFDLRIYQGDLTEYLTDLYNDVRYNNEPKQLLPSY